MVKFVGLSNKKRIAVILTSLHGWPVGEFLLYLYFPSQPGFTIIYPSLLWHVLQPVSEETLPQFHPLPH